MSHFDAIVVGAGMAGCLMARDLAAGGLRVAVLEAGPERAAADVHADDGRPTTRSDRHRFAREGQAVQARNVLFAAHNRRFYVDDRKHPYLADRPFLWFRGRQVGGRSILWSRACLRMSDREFVPHPGVDAWENWPFGHAELAPFYARIEREFRVTGEACGIEVIPDGAFVAPAATSPRIDAVLERVRRQDPALRATRARTAALDRDAVPAPSREAVRHGARVFADSPVARVLFAPGTRRASGVEIVRPDGSRQTMAGRVVVLCASTIETVRILWQSRSEAHPHGLGNHADRLGRGVQDHLAVNCAGRLAADLRAIPHRSLADPGDPWREEPAHALVWGREPRGGQHAASPPIDCLASVALSPQRAAWSMLVLGSSRPLPANRITVDRSPDGGVEATVPRITFTRTADDVDRLAALGRFTRRVVRAGGLGGIGVTWLQRIMHRAAPGWAMARCRRAPGAVIHETGGARMGVDPAESVVDPTGRCWGVDNVFVADGSVFPGSGFQNPTLTILALAARTAEHILRDRAAWQAQESDRP